MKRKFNFIASNDVNKVFLTQDDLVNMKFIDENPAISNIITNFQNWCNCFNSVTPFKTLEDAEKDFNKYHNSMFKFLWKDGSIDRHRLLIESHVTNQ